jgi:hypothetical protein
MSAIGRLEAVGLRGLNVGNGDVADVRDAWLNVRSRLSCIDVHDAVYAQDATMRR